MNITEDILKKSLEIAPKLKEVRREIHENPELGCEIDKTEKLIIECLKELGLEIISGGRNGIVGVLQGEGKGKTVLIRADIDALPICELTKKDYSSKIENRMHACGHDAHTTWVLGAATILSSLKKHINGTIKFAFQPCEEGTGGVGAMDMIESGILENPKVDVAIAAHVFPEIPTGKFGIKSGAVTSTPSGFKIEIIGKSGHASEPSKCIDPIMILNQIYTGLQGIQRVTVDPDHPAVISVTKIHAGESHNIIPESAYMSGTIRTFSVEDNKNLASKIKETSEAIAKIYGAKAEFSYNIPIVSCVNDKEISSKMIKSAQKIMQCNDAVIDPPIFMGGDDFSFYTEKVPSCYFFVGVRNEEKDIVYPIHNDKFDLDEDCLHNAAAIMAQFAIDYLGEGEDNV